MHMPSNKKVVCITGSVWTGSRVAPRRMLVKDGFLRPTWFTTGRPLTDAEYRHVSVAQFHLTNAEKNVLAHIDYAGGVVGVMREDFESAMVNAEKGVLVVAPPGNCRAAGCNDTPGNHFLNQERRDGTV